MSSEPRCGARGIGALVMPDPGRRVDVVVDFAAAVGAVDDLGGGAADRRGRQLAVAVLIDRGHRPAVRRQRQQHPQPGVLGQVGRGGTGVEIAHLAQTLQIDDGHPAARGLRHEHHRRILGADLQIASRRQRRRQPGGRRRGAVFGDLGHPLILGDGHQGVPAIRPHRLVQRRADRPDRQLGRAFGRRAGPRAGHAHDQRADAHRQHADQRAAAQHQTGTHSRAQLLPPALFFQGIPRLATATPV